MVFPGLRVDFPWINAFIVLYNNGQFSYILARPGNALNTIVNLNINSAINNIVFVAINFQTMKICGTFEC